LKKQDGNLFTSTDPNDVSWRVEQAKVDNFIEGVTPDHDIEAYVLALDKSGLST
jgi:hypothetical protein